MHAPRSKDILWMIYSQHDLIYKNPKNSVSIVHIKSCTVSTISRGNPRQAQVCSMDPLGVKPVIQSLETSVQHIARLPTIKG